MTNTADIVAGPSIGGINSVGWSSWHSSGAIITSAQSPIKKSLGFSFVADPITGGSPYNIQIRYFNGVEYVTEQHLSTGDLNVDVTVGGGEHDSLSAISLRVQSSTLPIVVRVQTDDGVQLLPNAAAITWGDPHLVTFDKSAYDFQVPGEHVLAKSTIDDFEIQVRTEPMPGSTTIAYNTAVATSLNGTRVGLYLPPRIPGRQYGSLGDDRLEAKPETTLLLAGQDSGRAQVNAGNSVSFVSSLGDYPSMDDTFGWYVKGEAGNPVSGQVIWANTQTVEVGDTVSYAPDIPKERLGFFIVRNGAHQGNSVANGDLVTFQQTDGKWAVLKEGVVLNSYQNGKGFAYAFFTDIALNADGIPHHAINGMFQNMADAYGGCCLSDLGVSTAYSQTVSITAGDTIMGGAKPENFGYKMGSDGVDSVRGFNVSEDQVTIYDRGNGTTTLTSTEAGTFIGTTPADGGSPGGIFVEGVDAAALAPRIAFDNSTVIQSSPLYIGDTELRMNSGELKAVGDGLVYRDRNQYTVLTRSGDGFLARVYGDHIDVQPFLANTREPGTMCGLLGSNDGDAANDLSLRDGSVLGNPTTAATLYGPFTADWRVRQERSLFTYREGQNTSSFTDPAFTNQYLTAQDFPADAVASARAAAIAAGYNETNPLFNNMVLEVLAGGVDITGGVSGVRESDYTHVQEVEIVAELPTPAPTITATTSETLSNSATGIPVPSVPPSQSVVPLVSPGATADMTASPIALPSPDSATPAPVAGGGGGKLNIGMVAAIPVVGFVLLAVFGGVVAWRNREWLGTKLGCRRGRNAAPQHHEEGEGTTNMDAAATVPEAVTVTMQPEPAAASAPTVRHHPTSTVSGKGVHRTPPAPKERVAAL